MTGIRSCHLEALNLQGGSIRRRQEWKVGLETAVPNKSLRVNGGGILQKD